MNILTGVQNFLSFINNNWVSITAIITLTISICKKAKDYFSKTDEEKIAIAKAQIQETMLEMVTIAEISYEEWQKAGKIKRSQVIDEIFMAYPILSKVANQDELVEWIDNEIDNALKDLRKVIKINQESTINVEANTN